mgnify:CR=1 FL=1
MLREPVVAGMFYERDSYALKRQINNFLINVDKKEKPTGIVTPHAGYVYSGKVAGEVYSSIEIPETLIIMGPNHTGLGPSVSIMSEGVWRTPLGDAKINEPMAKEIIRRSKVAKKDHLAHINEHSIEVQLPFIQELKKSFTFIPIIFGESAPDRLKDVGNAIYDVIKEKNCLLISSTDLTHYEDADTARKKDTLVLETIEKLNEEEMLKYIQKYDISMCGWMPTYVLLYVCKLLGAKKGKIIKYMNSGDTSGDYSQVVGYGGAIIL